MNRSAQPDFDQLIDSELVRRIHALRDSVRRDLNQANVSQGINQYATDAQVEDWAPKYFPIYPAMLAVARKRGLIAEPA